MTAETDLALKPPVTIGKAEISTITFWAVSLKSSMVLPREIDTLGLLNCYVEELPNTMAAWLEKGIRLAL